MRWLSIHVYSLLYKLHIRNICIKMYLFQGGLKSELTITAYVTIALLEAGQDTKVTAFMCSSSIDYVSKIINNSRR